MYMLSEMKYIKYGNGMSNQKRNHSVPFTSTGNSKAFSLNFQIPSLPQPSPTPYTTVADPYAIQNPRDMITYMLIKDRITLRNHLLFICLTISLQMQDILETSICTLHT